jgi:RNA polymerase sigma-70 factor (ECF subfamily)
VYVWERRDRLLEIDRIEPYLFRMASNMVLQYIRHKKVVADYMAKKSYSQTRKEVFSSADIESDIDANDMALLIWQYVEAMPSRRKEIFKMSRYEGIKTDEIAETLGISKKTVENMLSLALSDIRKFVEKNS